MGGNKIYLKIPDCLGKSRAMNHLHEFELENYWFTQTEWAAVGAIGFVMDMGDIGIQRIIRMSYDGSEIKDKDIIVTQEYGNPAKVIHKFGLNGVIFDKFTFLGSKFTGLMTYRKIRTIVSIGQLPKFRM